MVGFDWFRTVQLRQVIALAFAAAACMVVLVLALAGWHLQATLARGDKPDWLLLCALGMGGPLASLLAVWLLLDRHLGARAHDRRALPARPEFYAAGARNEPMHLEELRGRRLRELSFVVFDTETTGLAPSGGDEIVSIAAVRIRNGRVEDQQPFSRLVDPGRPIPRASTRFHGITNGMVRGEPAITDVLPAFRAFAGDAVLVAHNAAFDMRFLKLKEEAAGTRIDNLVLDSLLLSVFLDQESRNHDLDAVAERLGVTIDGRHTALGDARVTARVFLRMLDMLETRGVTTLRQAVTASLGVEHIRRMQRRF